MTIRVEIQGEVEHQLWAQAWEWYQTTFEEINRLAVQRHMANSEEWSEMRDDTALLKFLAFNGDELVGVGVMTNDLYAWGLISPQYFEYHFPNMYNEDRIWYCGFVGASDGNGEAFSQLVTEMHGVIKSNNGMVCIDYCAVNVAIRRMPERVDMMLRRLDPLTQSWKLDTHEFWLYTFGSNEGARIAVPDLVERA